MAARVGTAVRGVGVDLSRACGSAPSEPARVFGRHIDCVLFDMDGTLVDTERMSLNTIRRQLAEWNHVFPPGEESAFEGMNWDDTLEKLFRKFPPPENVPPAEARKMLLSMYEKDLGRSVQIIPGSTDAVNYFADRMLIGLVSGSTRAMIHQVLTHLDLHRAFRAVLGSEDFSPGKPSPAGFLKACKQLGREPSRCLVFEDSIPGLLSARAAGMWVVAVVDPAAPSAAEKIRLAHFAVDNFLPVNHEWFVALEDKLDAVTATPPPQ